MKKNKKTIIACDAHTKEQRKKIESLITSEDDPILIPGDTPVLPRGNNPIDPEKLSEENQKK